jgi:hypothetical protein
LLHERAAGRADGEEMQRVVDVLVQAPRGARAHLRLDDPQSVEFAMATRGYTLLRGRADVNTCTSWTDAAVGGPNAGYVGAEDTLLRESEATGVGDPVVDVVGSLAPVPRAPLLPFGDGWWRRIEEPLGRVALRLAPPTPCYAPGSPSQ